MIKRIALLIAIVLLLIPGSIVMASDITDAGYAGIIRVSNNSTETQNVAVPVTGVNSTNLINAGFLASNASDCTIRQSGSDIPFMPGYALNPWCLWVTDIGTSTYYSDVLYTPNVTGGEIRYFPDTTGMTISDDASLEVGDNFTITMNNIYLNTANGTSKNIIRKDDAFRVYVSDTVSGNVTVSITHEESYSPVSHTDVSGKWVNGTSAYDNNITTYAYANIIDTTWSDYIILTRAPLLIDNFSIYWENSTSISDSDIDAYYDGAWHDIYAGNIASDGWINYPLGSTEMISDIRIKVYRNGVTAPRVNEVAFDYTGNPTLTLTGISSGEYDVTVSANTTHLSLDIGGTSNSTVLGGVSVLDNANDWIFFENDSVIYAGKTVFEVGGANITSIEWEYGSVFHDSIGSNDATPSFRTVSSDADVSAELIEFLPIAEATAPAYSVTEAEPFLTTTPTITSDFTTDSSNSTLPGSEVISETATAGGTPVSLPFTILGCFGLLTVSFTASYLTKKSGSASIWPKMLCVGIAAGLLVGVKVFDFWMITYLLMMIVAFSMAKTHATWGGEAGYNVVGFLAMSFVGMTIINRVMEGVFINSTDVGILNNVLVFRPVNVFGLFQISVPNLDFLSTGIPHLMRWDYSFFGGNAVIIQYMFYSITAFVAFLLFVLMLGVVFNMLSRNR